MTIGGLSMRAMSRTLPALLLGLALAAPAGAETRNESSGVVPPEIAEAADSVMRLFTSLIGAIPTYEAPELMPNGDIVIRRKQPTAETPAPAKPAEKAVPDETVPTKI